MTRGAELEARIAPYWAERPVWRGLDIDPGWYDLVDALVTDLEALGPMPEIHQIKTKFGGLRFYVGNATPAQQETIRLYEARSLEVCEKCGMPGNQAVIGHWVSTLCNECLVLEEDRRTAKFKFLEDSQELGE